MAHSFESVHVARANADTLHIGEDDLDVGDGDQGIVRKSGNLWWFRPDSKAWLTIECAQRADGSEEPQVITTATVYCEGTVDYAAPAPTSTVMAMAPAMQATDCGSNHCASRGVHRPGNSRAGA